MGEKIDVEYELIRNETRSKICPLTGERVYDHSELACLRTDCSLVAENRYQTLYGYRYRCAVEKKNIEEEHARQLKRAEYYRKLGDSLEAVRGINLEEFFELCNRLDHEMIESRQEYSGDMSLNLYHDEENKCLVYRFEDDAVAEISVTDNPFSYFGAKFEAIRSSEKKGAISCCAVPGYLADAINVNLQLKHKMDVKGILHHDNPVYIKARGMGKYIEAAYGWDWLQWKRVRDQHLEMAEIVNFDNIIYIKQELDEIIRREYG